MQTYSRGYAYRVSTPAGRTLIYDACTSSAQWAGDVVADRAERAVRTKRLYGGPLRIKVWEHRGELEGARLPAPRTAQLYSYGPAPVQQRACVDGTCDCGSRGKPCEWIMPHGA